jgi:hypothetical protein
MRRAPYASGLVGLYAIPAVPLASSELVCRQTTSDPSSASDAAMRISATASMTKCASKRPDHSRGMLRARPQSPRSLFMSFHPTSHTRHHYKQAGAPVKVAKDTLDAEARTNHGTGHERATARYQAQCHSQEHQRHVAGGPRPDGSTCVTRLLDNCDSDGGRGRYRRGAPSLAADALFNQGRTLLAIPPLLDLTFRLVHF